MAMDKVDIRKLREWPAGVDGELFNNEVTAMMVYGPSGEYNPPNDESMRGVVLMIYFTVFGEGQQPQSSHVSLEADSCPEQGLDLLVHKMLKWESGRQRMVPLLLVSWRNRARSLAMKKTGRISGSYEWRDKFVSIGANMSHDDFVPGGPTLGSGVGAERGTTQVQEKASTYGVLTGHTRLESKSPGAGLSQRRPNHQQPLLVRKAAFDGKGRIALETLDAGT